ncbi:antitoxin VbhA family protein, partial [Curtobacterium sp. MCBD17_030]|uniref:antitoxin VbhA family protein n=1 Tax=Curtobacterium sp. MCBD17_030 TaxID=2175649 RepID=UPI000D8BD0CA
YELYDKHNTVLSDLTVPAVREANRIVQTLLIPAAEVARREKAVRAVIHSGYLEGFPDDMPWQSQLWMYARGEITPEQLSAYADDGRQIPRAPEPSAVNASDVPEDWWRTTQARIRRHLLDSTLTEAEAAAALQISIHEVGELFGSNRLLSFDLEGEERIPDWQILAPALPEFGDPSALLPGLEVLYAAAPQPLLDAAAMTEIMTTPCTHLIVENHALTPLQWLREGRPLETVIALFRGREW